MTISDDAPRSGDFSVRLPFDRGSARTARQLVDALLSSRGVGPEQRQDAALVMHELVINAVIHGRPDPQDDRIGVRGRVVDGQLVLTVIDCGQTGRIVVRPPSSDAPNGRGLAIVAALSASWTVDRSDGTQVSARLPI